MMETIQIYYNVERDAFPGGLAGDGSGGTEDIPATAGYAEAGMGHGRGLFKSLFPQDADIRQVAVFLGAVQPIADHKPVGYVHAAEINLHVGNPAFRLI